MKAETRPFDIFKLSMTGMIGTPVGTVNARTKTEAVRLARQQFGPGTYSASEGDPQEQRPWTDPIEPGEVRHLAGFPTSPPGPLQPFRQLHTMWVRRNGQVRVVTGDWDGTRWTNFRFVDDH